MTTPPDETSQIELHELRGAPRDFAMALYAAGVRAGIEMGRAQAEADMDSAWARVADRVRAIANTPTFAVLCERRGQADRAERARQHEARLGLRGAS